MDISCMPYDIKLIIMSYLPINMLIIDNPPKIFHDYIIHYIKPKNKKRFLFYYHP